MSDYAHWTIFYSKPHLDAFVESKTLNGKPPHVSVLGSGWLVQYD